MREKVVVLDFTTANVWVYNLPEEHMQYEEVEEWLSTEMKLNINNCQWMAGTLEINYESTN